MEGQKFSADQIFDGKQFLPAGTVVVVNNEGRIIDLTTTAEAGADVEHLNGILTPGLINAHCHLELSHFKNKIEPGGGLVKFLLSVVSKRKEPWPEDWKREQIAAAATEMQAAGIVGVGDICNTTDAIATKLESGMEWHNLVEVLNFTDETLPPRLAHNQQVLDAHLAAGLRSTVLTPHAPYSVSCATFEALNKATANQIISIHNQETGPETELFQKGSGDFFQLYALTGTPPLGCTGKSSLQSWLPYFTKGQKIVLVHNTFTQKEDLDFAQRHADQHGLELAFCLCPNANLYIEGKLPQVNLFLEAGCKLVLGTDSYSSNWQLSIAAEMKALLDHFPELPLEMLLTAATSNGADAFNWPHLGRLQKGIAPGLTLLHTNTEGNLTGSSRRVM